MTDQFYIDWAEGLGLSSAQVSAKAHERCKAALKAGVSYKSIYWSRLGNPFMSDSAWQLMVNQAVATSGTAVHKAPMAVAALTAPKPKRVPKVKPVLPVVMELGKHIDKMMELTGRFQFKSRLA